MKATIIERRKRILTGRLSSSSATLFSSTQYAYASLAQLQPQKGVHEISVGTLTSDRKLAFCSFLTTNGSFLCRRPEDLTFVHDAQQDVRSMVDRSDIDALRALESFMAPICCANQKPANQSLRFALPDLESKPDARADYREGEKSFRSSCCNSADAVPATHFD